MTARTGTVLGTGTYQFKKQNPAEMRALRSLHSVQGSCTINCKHNKRVSSTGWGHGPAGRSKAGPGSWSAAGWGDSISVRLQDEASGTSVLAFPLLLGLCCLRK